MQLKDTRREIKTIDLLPLINVVFLLILFVLIAGRPSTNHPSGLEVARSTVETTHRAAALSVWLKQDDAFYLSESKAVTLGELSQLVEEKGLAAQGLPLELIADRRAHAKELLAFRRAMARAGVGDGLHGIFGRGHHVLRENLVDARGQRLGDPFSFVGFCFVFRFALEVSFPSSEVGSLGDPLFENPFFLFHFPNS